MPPPGKAGCVRAADLLEGWARACMEDPTKTLLPEDKWPDQLPQPQELVESQKDWHEICAGAAERGIFTFLNEQDVFHFHNKPLLNGLFGGKEEQKFGQRRASPAHDNKYDSSQCPPADDRGRHTDIAVFWTIVSHFG